MLEGPLSAAGRVLELTTRSPGPELRSLSDAWERTGHGDRPDWKRLRLLLDELAARPELVTAAVARPPAPRGSQVMDALLAGLADKLADDAGVARPAWTRHAPRLRRPWSTPGTPDQVAHRLEQTPVQLRERNIVVDAASLWRDTTVSGG